MKLYSITKFSALVPLLFLITACATNHQSAENNLDTSVNDPYEEMNRKIFAFNQSFDRAILRPISSGYKAVLPKPAQDGVSNAMRNLREPWVFVNDILQFKFKRAATTLTRFVMNTTVGLAGLFKASDGIGIPYHSEDLGQTLAVWGIGDGAYWVVPFLGPSNGRDFAGLGASFFLDPVTYTLGQENETTLNYIRTGVDVLDARVRVHEALDGLYAEDDPYVVFRSLYLQNRRFEIHDGNPPANQEEEDFFDSLEDDDLN
ncbi:MlaA family lipoprotein [Kordiimonas aquimaris]|uniref:MlaA family lipoprotein n=1 Tax=Kordiimonas aquimaris TaxID=707591 RepID=UPI0021D389C2|nr:VacJ family lipoprotein [Kordiimonas aquimaris]